MKIPRYRFDYFVSANGGTWRLSTDSGKSRTIMGIRRMSVKPSPVPTLVLLSILSLYGRLR
jgi:hypothetical protein